MRTHFYHDASTHDWFCDRRVVEMDDARFVWSQCVQIDFALFLCTYENLAQLNNSSQIE